jgi:hypothetical protein
MMASNITTINKIVIFSKHITPGGHFLPILIK